MDRGSRPRLGGVRFILLLLVAGCASRPPIEKPTIRFVPPALIADSGASLYVLEGRDDWVDELELDRPAWIGPEALKKVLRYGLSQKDLILVGHADFQPAEGIPTEATLFNPDSPGHPARSDQGSVGFRVKVTAKSAADAKNCRIEWTAEKLADIAAKGKETRRDVARIGEGTHTIPFGAALVIRHAIGEGREYALLLRIASLEEP